MNNVPEIVPGVGLGMIRFGQSIDETVRQLGEPDFVHDMTEEEGLSTVLMGYEEKGLLTFFEITSHSTLASIELSHGDALLYGKPVFQLSERELIDWMKQNGFNELETDTEINSEKRISFEDAMIDFYFSGGKLRTINWGVLVTETGEIEVV